MIKTRGEKIFDVVNVIIMIIIAVVMLYPFLNVLAISLNDAYDSLAGGITIFPRKFTFASYQSVMKYENLFSAFWISVSRTIITTVFALILTSLTAFALTKRALPGYSFFYYFFIVSMFLPVLLIPSFMLYKQIHIYNTFLVYVLPGLFATNNMILFRTFIIQLPAGLEESAYLDGANEITVFFRIVLPLCKPILATIGLFIAVYQWNAWQDTLYYVTNTKLESLQFVLMKVIKQAEASAIASEDKTSKLMQLGANTVTPNSIKMAITIIATVPIICVYPFLQKYFVKGMMVGAVKG